MHTCKDQEERYALFSFWTRQHMSVHVMHAGGLQGLASMSLLPASAETSTTFLLLTFCGRPHLLSLAIYSTMYKKCLYKRKTTLHMLGDYKLQFNYQFWELCLQNIAPHVWSERLVYGSPGAQFSKELFVSICLFRIVPGIGNIVGELLSWTC